MSQPADSFESHYSSIAAALHTWACLTVGPTLRSRVDPQDLVQEASARAFEHFSDFDPELGSFRAWIFRIAQNCRNEVLRRVTRARVPGDQEARASQCPASVTNISRRLARDEALQHLLEYVEQFDELDRELFLRCGLQGERVAKAAVRMGLSEDAAQKRWERLREKLRDRPRVRELLAPTA